MREKIKYILPLLVIIAVFFTSCEPDENDDNNTGDPRDYYTGTWFVEETSTLYTDPITYSVTISAHPTEASMVLISNFYHLGYAEEDRVEAIVSETTITVEQQSVCNNLVNGSGSLQGSKIMWTYFVNDGADVDEVTSIYTKQ